MNNQNSEMTAEAVIELLQLFDKNNIVTWVDGGWGVDALLGKQTRKHTDLDIAVLLSDMPKIQSLVTASGYKVVEDEMPTRLDMRDNQDHRIDFHPLTFDEHGNGLQQLQDGSFGTYTAEGLSGAGVIGGVKVKCLSPAIQVYFHTGYEPDEDDFRDVQALCKKFGLEIPQSLKRQL